MSSKFEIYLSGKQYFFRLKTGNSEIVLQSEAYNSLQGCMSGINSVKVNAIRDERYTRLKGTNGKYYFYIRASNNEIIGTSEMYESSSGMESAISSVKTIAPSAPTLEIR